jgi:O-antigen/teichoic acid export membrane protein
MQSRNTAAVRESVGVISPAEPVVHPRLAKNYALLTAGECVSKVLAFAAFTWLGRVLGPERYGLFEFTLAAMVFFTLPVDLGLGDYGAREVSKHRSAAPTLLNDIAGLRLLLAACSFCALLVFVLLLNKSADVKLLFLGYGLSLFGAPVLLQWFFQAHERMQWVAAASITRQTVFALVVFAVARSGRPLAPIGLAECAAVYTTGVVSLLLLTRRMGFRAPRPSFRPRPLIAHLRQAAPIGLSELGWAFQWYFATVLLGFLVADRSLGWFGASNRIVIALHTFVWLYFFNLLPSISRSAAGPPSGLLELMRRSLTVSAWAGIFVALMVTLVSHTLMAAAYGARYAAAGNVLSVLIWMIPVSLLSGHYRYTLIGYGRQKLLLAAITCSAVLAVLLCCALIPIWGALGAACALVAANLVNFGLAYYFVRREVLRIPFHRQLSGPAIALASSAAVFAALVRFNPWVAVTAASGLYIALLFLYEGAGVWSLMRSLVAGSNA